MRRFLLATAVLCAILMIAALHGPAFAHRSGCHRAHTCPSDRGTYGTVAGGSRSTAQRGRLARSTAARGAFQRAHPCPATGRQAGACPGYVVDHVVPLKRGGPDRPSNMQWQTVEDAKAKDRIE